MKKHIFGFVVKCLGIVVLSLLLNPIQAEAQVGKTALLREINSVRAMYRLPALVRNPQLDQAAKLKAQDMAKKGYFAHVSPSNKTPWHWMKLTNYYYTYAGENLAMNFEDTKDLLTAWLSSSGHRANILSRNYTDVGYAAIKTEYRGQETVFIVQLFGNQV